ncbi:WD domain, G-beta repeat domain-containing protein [Plasmodium vivax India VII]|uniref:methylated diphthine methylhydrolase n=3 Tax=Plasmodium vivax TaxID=5855 RepID=A0A0J9T9P0_PLAVI|nr:WD domain, G-beta repeat domain-containing protein [Plasmodium vivax India VII]KMZ92235.1 WD domain, G-beta repeat domain-containing protein [Plasmodium vivax Mauritania I]KMZ98532.1 WD domain, G-beta repeat domain-containing protein [Plasmodium vivax North Korean]
MIKRKYNLKYCCDDICVFPSSTWRSGSWEKFSPSFGLTAISTYQLKVPAEDGGKGGGDPTVETHHGEQKKKGKVYLYRLEEDTTEDGDPSEKSPLLTYHSDINFRSGVLQSSYLFTHDSLLLGSVCVNGFHLAHVKDGSHHLLFATPNGRDISGSDDCSFAIWDLRTMAAPSARNTKSHSQGVTAVKFDSFSQQLYTASYDNKIRIFDARNVQDPLRTVDVKSSIWRLKFLYKGTDVNELLVAACDGGAQLFKKINDEFIFDKGVPNGNELTYGIDAIDLADMGKEKKKIYLSCSFYNKEVQMWV